jgi:hypothetical protein
VCGGNALPDLCHSATDQTIDQGAFAALEGADDDDKWFFVVRHKILRTA